MTNNLDRLSGLADGVAYKVPVRAATTGNINLIGLQTIDGTALAAGDRVLVWQQTDPTQNGIYNASLAAWSRAIDFSNTSAVTRGTQVLVTDGGTYVNASFFLAVSNVTFGTSDVTFTLYTNAPTGGDTIDFATVAAATAASIPAAQKYLRVAGYHVAGDGGAALYIRITTPGSPQPWQFQSADGGWWQLTETTIDPRMLGAKGDGTTDDGTALTNTLAAAAALAAAVRIAAPHVVGTNLAIPVGLSVAFTPFGSLKPSATFAVTVAGLIVAGPWLIFDTTAGGTVVGSSGCITLLCHPEWWGAQPGTTIDAAPACNAAHRFAEFNEGTVQYQALPYYCYSTVTILGAMWMRGAAPPTGQTLPTNMYFANAPAGSDGIAQGIGTGSAPGIYGVRISDIAITRPTVTPGAGGAGFVSYGGAFSVYERVYVNGFDTNILLTQAGNAQPSINPTFRDCSAGTYGTSSIHVLFSSDASFFNGRFQGQAGTNQVVIIEPGVDTTLFDHCVIGAVGITTYGIVLLGGVYTTIRNTDLEVISTAAILLNYGVLFDASAHALLVDDCFFDACGVPVMSTGIVNGMRIVNSRLTSSAIGFDGTTNAVACILVADVAATERPSRVLISGNTLTSAYAGASAIQLNDVQGAIVIGNTVNQVGAARGNAAVILGAATSGCVVTSNVIISSLAGGVTNLGTINVVANNANF